ncbi:MAG: hypothetical protein J5780_04215 [Treponema sp.]|nr:hypothetical protein [Treponema sp.]
MSLKLKTGVKILVSVILTALCMLFIFAGGFKFIEVKFYAPHILENINTRLGEVNGAFKEYTGSFSNTIEEYLSNEVLFTYFDRGVSEEEAALRQQETDLLFHKLPGLEGIRILDADGSHIHFSTYKSDILTDNDEIYSYKNYDMTEEEDLKVLVPPMKKTEPAKLYFDMKLNRLIFMHSVFGEFDVCKGVFFFYISGDDFVRYLVHSGITGVNTRGLIIKSDAGGGFVFQVPFTERESFLTQICAKWERNLFGVENLSSDGINTLCIVSRKLDIPVGYVCNESDFVFTNGEKLLLLLGTGVTLFLVIFIIFNLKGDESYLISSRIKQFQFALVREYIERKDSEDWETLAKEITRRKLDVNNEIKRSLGKTGKKHNEEIEELLDRSWSEVLSLLAGNQEFKKAVPAVRTEETPELKAGLIPDNAEEPAELEELDELADAGELEEPEELGEAEELEEPEELEELESDRPVSENDVEEIPAEMEELEEVEEIPASDENSPAASGGQNQSAFAPQEIPADDTIILPREESDFFEETTLEEFLADENPVNKKTENSEEQKQKAEENFNISPLDFSALDMENT